MRTCQDCCSRELCAASYLLTDSDLGKKILVGRMMISDGKSSRATDQVIDNDSKEPEAEVQVLYESLLLWRHLYQHLFKNREETTHTKSRNVNIGHEKKS